jgi:hypothetical protein
MSLDLKTLGKSIGGALAGSLEKDLPNVREFSKSEAQKLAQTLVQIEQLVAANQIDQDTALLLLDMQKHATRAVFLTVEGLGLLAVEKAINAALDVVKKTVNSAVKFELL